MPYSKIAASVFDLYWQSSYPQDHRMLIAPQIYLPPIFKSYRKSRDTTLETIIKHSEKPTDLF